jgi:hypothetical protein
VLSSAGTYGWWDVVPVALTAAVVLFVPGFAAARLVGVRGPLGLVVAPVTTTTAVVALGVGFAAVGLPWTTATLVLGVLVTWCLAYLVGLPLRRRSARSVPEASASDRAFWLAIVGASIFGLIAVTLVLAGVASSPEAFPQHPDTIFHLGDAQWMLEHRDASVLHAHGFDSPLGTGFYPAAFHVLVASTAMLTGVPVVVATTAFVIVVCGVAWPIGMVLLSRVVLAPTLAVSAAAAVAAMAFTVFPYKLLGFGVLWPNAFGQALVPATLGAALLLVRGYEARRNVARGPLAVVTIATIPGLVVAHPNALFTLAILLAVAITGAVVSAAWRSRDRPRRAAAQLGLLALGLAATAAAVTTVRPANMVATGDPGPELDRLGAFWDLFWFAPRGARDLHLVTVGVLVGLVWVAVRVPRGRWIIPAFALTWLMVWLNVAVDDPATRYLTWPWYNQAFRLGAVNVIPAALLLTAGLVTAATALTAAAHALRLRSAWLPALATALTLIAFVAATRGGVGAHRQSINYYFHPTQAGSWATPKELMSLRALARHIPADAVVAANPWNGGTYLYVVSGRRLLIPTEKALSPGDRTLIASSLDQAGTDPAVCAAVRRQHVTYAITGGDAFHWAAPEDERAYAGIDAVGRSSAFTKVSASAPYTLYRLTSCAD